jgi:hypothetical protein
MLSPIEIGSVINGLYSYNFSPNLWIPISLISLGELLIFFGYTEPGIIVHGLNLIFIILCYALHEDRAYLALIFMPLFRMLNISMPIFFSLTLYTFALIYAPMAIPIYFVWRSGKFSDEELGLKGKNLSFYLPMAVALGLILGWVEYSILHPEVLVPDFSLKNIIMLSIIMIFFVGFVEEFIFRSTLQTVLKERFGTITGLVVASLIFGIMHSGYRLPVELIFVSFGGLVFGVLFQKSRSLAAASLAHGVTNISLFLISPVNPLLIVQLVIIAVLLAIPSGLKRNQDENKGFIDRIDRNS